MCLVLSPHISGHHPHVPRLLIRHSLLQYFACSVDFEVRISLSLGSLWTYTCLSEFLFVCNSYIVLVARSILSTNAYLVDCCQMVDRWANVRLWEERWIVLSHLLLLPTLLRAVPGPDNQPLLGMASFPEIQGTLFIKLTLIFIFMLCFIESSDST